MYLEWDIQGGLGNRSNKISTNAGIWDSAYSKLKQLVCPQRTLSTEDEKKGNYYTDKPRAS